MTALLAIGALALAAWVGLLLHPARAWRLEPVGEDDVAADPPAWPAVAVLVPARNEAGSLPLTLPALLAQDYPGPLRIVLVDDRSTDGTAGTARRIARESAHADRLDVLEGAPLPDGWLGKMWALEQASRHALAARDGALAARDGALAARPDLVLLTDADILHSAASVRRLVADLVARDVVLDSRMARLRCESPAEKLLVPAFTWFFGLLYPFRWVNDPRRATAAAAGGCVLLRASVLRRVGAFEPLKDRLIDDVSLGRLVKRADPRVRLAHSRSDVASVRPSPQLRDVWRMVARSAFTELRGSWLRLAACLVVLAIVFVAPPLLVVLGLALRAPALLAEGAAAWLLMSALHAGALRAFGLPAWRALLLPAVGALYGAMTLDSALRSLRDDGPRWRDDNGSR
jgi:hopene-associated glycosyltransferase HpnB